MVVTARDVDLDRLAEGRTHLARLEVDLDIVGHVDVLLDPLDPPLVPAPDPEPPVPLDPIGAVLDHSDRPAFEPLSLLEAPSPLLSLAFASGALLDSVGGAGGDSYRSRYQPVPFSTNPPPTEMSFSSLGWPHASQVTRSSSVMRC